MRHIHLAAGLIFMAITLFFALAAISFFVAIVTQSIWPAITGLTASAAMAMFARIADEELR